MAHQSSKVRYKVNSGAEDIFGISLYQLIPHQTVCLTPQLAATPKQMSHLGVTSGEKLGLWDPDLGSCRELD